MKHRAHLSLISLTAALFALAPHTARAAWTVEPIAVTTSSGYAFEIKLNAAGAPHILYVGDGSNRPMNFAVRDAATWTQRGPIPYADAFALDNNGEPYFLSTPSPNFFPQLQHLLSDGSLTSQPVANLRVSLDAFLQFDSQNRPHVGYVDTTARQLKHAVWDGSQWQTQIVASGNQFRYVAYSVKSAIDPQGRMHFVWPDEVDVLHHARPTSDTAWQDTTPFPTLDARPHDVAIDAAGQVHLAYDVFTGNVHTGGLFCGKYDGAAWTGSRVSGLDDFGIHQTRIVPDGGGVPHIFTYDSTFDGPDVLKHVFPAGASWANEIVATNPPSNIQGPQDIAAALRPDGYHVLFRTGDYAVNYATQPISFLTGDANRDGKVNRTDLADWKLSFAVNLAANADGLGITDGHDFLAWQRGLNVLPPATPPTLVNANFNTGSLPPWSSFTTPNGNVTTGFPSVESFDVDGDGQSSPAMRIRVGQNSFDANVGAGGGVQQAFNVAATGDFQVTAKIASRNLDTGGNTGPGDFQFLIDGVIVGSLALDGTLISPGETLRRTLTGQVFGLTAGSHTLQVRVTRTATNSRLIYQYVDDVTFSTLLAAKAVPEPTAAAMILAAALATTHARRRAPI